MTVEVKLTGPSMEERIAKRLRSSGDPRADFIKQMGEGPTRTFTHGHLAGHVVLPGTAAHECGPQEQEHYSEATQQETKAYFTGSKRGGDDD